MRTPVLCLLAVLLAGCPAGVSREALDAEGDDASDGGGGGGAGGAVLLEAPIIDVAGDITVAGGAGGASATVPGGAGAMGGELDGVDGTQDQSDPARFSGGGGGAGRIRFHTKDGMVRTAATATLSPPLGLPPATTCSTGVARLQTDAP